MAAVVIVVKQLMTVGVVTAIITIILRILTVWNISYQVPSASVFETDYYY